MTIWEAIGLGVVQGLTEFLPVSSSGHLVLLQHLFGLQGSHLAFDVGVHLGTLVAVLVVLRQDLAGLLHAVAEPLRRRLRPRAAVPRSDAETSRRHRLLAAIVVASVPTGIMGLAGHRFAEELFGSPALVGVALVCLAAVLWSTRGRGAAGRDEVSWGTALGVGIVQGLAIVPGISRSGSTIAAGVLGGLDRRTAGRFSFLISIPAVSGAGLLSLRDLTRLDAHGLQMVAVGALTAAAVGYAALRWLLHLVDHGRLHRFAPYCVLVGLLALGATRL